MASSGDEGQPQYPPSRNIAEEVRKRNQVKELVLDYDPRQGRATTEPIHRRPRAFFHRPDADPEEAERARKEARVTDALRLMSWDDFRNFPRMPCVRDALLPAIAGGTAIGCTRFVIGGSVAAGCGWALGTYSIVSSGVYMLCQRRRRKEIDGIRQAVYILDQKEKEKKAKEEAENLRKQEEDRKRQEASLWNKVKFW